MTTKAARNLWLNGEDGNPMIINRHGEFVTLADVRRSIMNGLRLVSSVYTAQERGAAVDALLADPAWLRRCNGQFLGATARDGFSAAFQYLPTRHAVITKAAAKDGAA